MEKPLRLVQVPPPADAPIDQKADELLLIPGLRAEKSSQFRCVSCSQMTGRDPWIVWVPDGVRKGDSPAAVSEACRLSAYNGERGGWCLSCARSLNGSAILPEVLSMGRRAENRGLLLMGFGIAVVLVGWLGGWLEF